LYTAYTVIAVPALVYAVGAYGFCAVPYTIIIYPLLFVAFPRLWSVTHRRGYLTAGDFVLGRYGNKWLELAIALTGILATMPYIALQLVGIEKVIQALGFEGEGFASHLPLTIAFVILALYTYKSGLRAPAMIAFVKDVMIYVFVVAAIIIIPAKRCGGRCVCEEGWRHRSHPKAGPDRTVYYACHWIGDGAVHLPAFPYRHSVGFEFRHHQTQCHRASGLFAGVGSDRRIGAHGSCRRHCRVQPARCGAAAVSQDVSRLVCTLLL